MDTHARQSTPTSIWGPCFAGLVFLAYAVLLLAHRAPPSLTDFADWTYEGVLFKEHLLGHPDPAHLLKPYPVPNSAATIGIGLLALILPWTLAAKAWLIAQFVLTFAAMWQIARTVQASTLFWLVLPQAAFLNINFWFGLVNFQLGLCWILLLVSILLRRREGETADWPIGLLLLLAFFTHMLPFAFCVLLVIFYCHQIGSWKLLRQLIPGALLTLWYAFGRFVWAHNADGQVGITAKARDYSLDFWIFKLITLPRSIGFVNPVGAIHLLGEPLFLCLFAFNFLLAAVLLIMLYRTARRVWRTRTAGEQFKERSKEQFLWNTALLMLPCFLLIPGGAFGVYDPGGRLVEMALVIALPLCMSQHTANARWLTRIAGASSLALTAAGLYLFATLVFQPSYSPHPSRLPHPIANFAHVPNFEQDAYYRALDHGYVNFPVFPTGMFLSRRPVPGSR